MQQILYDSYLDYLKTKGIVKVDSFNVHKQKLSELTEKEVEGHLKVLSEFHYKASNFDGFIRNRMNNNTGKLVEDFKIQIRKLRKELINIDKKENRDSFEELLLIHGPKLLKNAEVSLDYLYTWGYIDIITRSMRRTEVCLEDVGINNIRYNNGIEIVNFKDCAYNMVEIDGFYFLSKLKRKGLKFNWDKIVYSFCGFEGLGINSEKFILALMSYPYEFMKCCDKYRQSKIKFVDDEKLKENSKYRGMYNEENERFVQNLSVKLQKAIKQDNQILI